jgi:hypothetical protein
MGATELRYRQIHLDFHTSEHIAGIGADFDPDEFAGTLERARVDSITCFARCHHGWLYYDTKAHPERRHPHLTRNLLAEQIDACHARNIRVPIYTTIQWDRLTATEHPEWLVVSAEGAIQSNPPYGAGFYAFLCLNSPYRDFLKAHVQDIFESLPAVDGFFFDIMQPRECSCPRCRANMEAMGLDPADPAARSRYAVETQNDFMWDLSAFVRTLSADATIFYNGAHVGPRHRLPANAFTHWELESLPSGGWGYMHLPVALRFARTLGLDSLSMSAKFHTSWGDFHSFKNQAALEFECFRAMALGAKCSVGDQLHPSGRICQATYDLVGAVYTSVEAKEAWCRGARAVTEIGLFSPEEFTGEKMHPAVLGAVRMLQEGGHQFDLVDTQSDLSTYRLLVLPDVIPVSEKLAATLTQHAANGGAVVASYQSGTDAAQSGFGRETLGVTAKGEAPYSPDFLRPKGALAKNLPEAELVMYLKGMEVEPGARSEVLADVVVPYFNRGIRFCSHKHTPSSGVIGYPGVIRSGNAIYFAHPIFRQYQENAPRWCKQLVLNAVDLLLPDPLVRTNAPSTALVTVNEQLEEGRWVVHLLHYIPERRGADFDIIEDVIPIFDVQVSLRTPRAARSVTCVPGGESVPFRETDGRLEFVVPRVNGHQMVAVQFGA